MGMYTELKIKCRLPEQAWHAVATIFWVYIANDIVKYPDPLNHWKFAAEIHNGFHNMVDAPGNFIPFAHSFEFETKPYNIMNYNDLTWEFCFSSKHSSIYTLIDTIIDVGGDILEGHIHHEEWDEPIDIKSLPTLYYQRQLPLTH